MKSEGDGGLRNRERRGTGTGRILAGAMSGMFAVEDELVKSVMNWEGGRNARTDRNPFVPMPTSWHLPFIVKSGYWRKKKI